MTITLTLVSEPGIDHGMANLHREVVIQKAVTKRPGNISLCTTQPKAIFLASSNCEAIHDLCLSWVEEQ